MNNSRICTASFNGISVQLFWRLEVEEFAKKKRIEVLLFYLNCWKVALPPCCSNPFNCQIELR